MMSSCACGSPRTSALQRQDHCWVCSLWYL
jgi:hypothetical protein